MNLTGKKAVVTGGGTGIGKATAIAFADAGAKVLITGRREDPLKKTASEHSDIFVCQSDVSAEEGPNQIVEAAVRRLGGIDVLVNNAGIFETAPVEETQLATFDSQMDTNVRSLYRLTQATLPELRKGKGPNIINIGSILSYIGIPSTSAYAATKGAVLQITRSLAVELGPEGIRCNCVCPGLVETEMTQGMINDPDFVKENLPTYPIGRFGKPEDIAAACIYLASDGAGWVTGVLLPVDGGYTAR